MWLYGAIAIYVLQCTNSRLRRFEGALGFVLQCAMPVAGRFRPKTCGFFGGSFFI